MERERLSDISEDQQRLLLSVAREVIGARLRGGELKLPEELDLHEVFREKRGVFVTLKKDGELRGCIGYPLPVKELLDAVMDNACSAAFSDPRFPPLGPEELEAVSIEISVLTVPRKVAAPEEVEVGRDGIIVSTSFCRGLLLPQVPLEQGWNRQQFLDYGCLKAGLPLAYWRSHPVTIETFQAQVFREERVS